MVKGNGTPQQDVAGWADQRGRTHNKQTTPVSNEREEAGGGPHSASASNEKGSKCGNRAAAGRLFGSVQYATCYCPSAPSSPLVKGGGGLELPPRVMRCTEERER